MTNIIEIPCTYIVHAWCHSLGWRGGGGGGGGAGLSYKTHSDVPPACMGQLRLLKALCSMEARECKWKNEKMLHSLERLYVVSSR